MSEIIPMGTKLLTSGKIITYSKQFIMGTNRKIQKIKNYEGNIKSIKENDYLEDLFLILKKMKN